MHPLSPSHNHHHPPLSPVQSFPHRVLRSYDEGTGFISHAALRSALNDRLKLGLGEGEMTRVSVLPCCCAAGACCKATTVGPRLLRPASSDPPP